MRKFILSLITYLSFLGIACATTPESSPLPSLRKQLASAASANDSVRILYDIFDLSPRAGQSEIAMELLHVAGRAHDYAAQNDMIRQLAVLHATDTERITYLITKALQLPKSVDRRITTLFVKHQHLASTCTAMTDQERQRRIAEQITAFPADTKADDLYEQFGRIYSVCVMLGQGSQGLLYIEALKRMGTLVEQMPPEAYPIKNQYYTALANIYTNTDSYAEGLAADRALLATIDRMQRNYRARGRRYRQFAPSRYNCYRRMLSNYRALTASDVEQIYSEVQNLCETNADVQANEQASPRARMYYLMATGQYKEAIPLIRKVLDDPRLKLGLRRRVLRELRVAADSTGNNTLLLSALREYTDIVEHFDSIRMAENLSELGIRYHVSELQRENARLAVTAQQDRIRHERQIRTYFVAVIICLVIVMILMIPMHRRNLKIRRAYEQLRDKPSSSCYQQDNEK